MDKEIYKSEFVQVLYTKKARVFKVIYFRETQNMTDNQWQEQMVNLKELYEELKPRYIIDDNRNRLYSYSPDMQAWTLNLFIPSWNKIGVLKYVQIQPNEIVGEISTYQIEELARNKFNMQFEHRIEDDYQAAIKWVNE